MTYGLLLIRFLFSRNRSLDRVWTNFPVVGSYWEIEIWTRIEVKMNKKEVSASLDFFSYNDSYIDLNYHFFL